MDNYEQILNLTFEIEGLLTLARQRGNEIPSSVLQLVKEKAALLDEMAAAIRLPETESDDEAIALSAEEEQIEDADPFDVDDEEEVETPVETAPEQPAEIPVVDEELTVGDDTQAEVEEEAGDDAPLTLADRLSIDQAKSKDIKRAFTLNDRFRFKRELFGNSESDFADALNVIAAMSTYEEAEEYFYNDLCWSADNDEVKDFMAVVRNHFS